MQDYSLYKSKGRKLTFGDEACSASIAKGGRSGGKSGWQIVRNVLVSITITLRIPKIYRGESKSPNLLALGKEYKALAEELLVGAILTSSCDLAMAAVIFRK